MKSNFTLVLDIFRHITIFVISIYLIALIWEWNWIVGLIAAIPIYVIIMNIIGFITLPIYALTPENRNAKKEFDDFNDDYLK